MKMKYHLAKYFLTKVSKVKIFHKYLKILAQMYIDIDKGFRFSYSPHLNGEIELLQALSKLYDGKKLIYFDVGVHLGTFTEMITDCIRRYEGHLFEISDRTFKKCVEKLGDNQCLIINNLGLSDSDGEVEIRYYMDAIAQSGISGVAAEKNFAYEIHKAQCTTGSIYCREKEISHIDFLKVDAEGYDLHVLRGFEDLLTKGVIDIMQFEYNYRHGDVHISMRDFYQYLTNYGYRIGALRQSGVDFKEFEPQDNSYDRGLNFVACREDFCKHLRHFKL